MSDATDTLKKLHTRVIDSRDGYKQARDQIESSERGAFIDRCLEERESFHAKIHETLRAEGVEVNEDGSMAAAAHRGIFQLRNALSSGNSGVYAECARGDSNLESTYDEAIEATKGHAEWQFLVEQRAKVAAAVKEAEALSK